MSYLYLIRFAEIGKEPHPEKSKQERDIEKALKASIKKTNIRKAVGRIFLETIKDETETLKKIHGIVSFSPCLKCPLSKLNSNVLAFAKKVLLGKKSFGVKVKRVGKHSFTSQQKSGELGELILDKFPKLKVNLKTPGEMIFVEIRNRDCYIYNKIIPGIDASLKLEKQIITEPKFIADDMLGKLAIRLRMLGFDTSYYRDSADSLLLRKSKEENRILLTRDLNLTKVRGANAFFITSKKLKNQLEEVIHKFNLKISPEQMFSRCSVCNEMLVGISKEKVKDKVPAQVYKLFNEFAYCSKCKKYYWKGTHYENIIEELKDFIT